MKLVFIGLLYAIHMVKIDKNYVLMLDPDVMIVLENIIIIIINNNNNKNIQK